MDIAAPDSIESRYGAEAAAEWRLLLNQFALGDGFALVILTVPGADGAAFCADMLTAFLAPQGRHLAYLASPTTQELHQLAPRLLSLADEAAMGAVWVTAAFPQTTQEQEAWEAAWHVALGSLNQQRNPLRRKFRVPVIVVGAPWLVPVMRQAAPDLWSVRSLVVRIEPAHETGVPAAGLIALEPARLEKRDGNAADIAPDPVLAMREAARLRGVPGREHTLAELLARAGEGFVARGALHAAEDAWREAAELDDGSATPTTAAAAWHNLAYVRHELGDREGAAAAAHRAVTLYRTLAAQNADAFRPDLAMSLNNLSNSLRDVGEREAALAAAREAGELYRALAAQRPDAFRPDLAMSLNNLAAMLSEFGEREGALAAAREAVDIRRALAAQRPDAFRPDLAMSLNNLATVLSALGEREAALTAAREAAELYRALAAQRPDAFRPHLAGSLNNLAAMLGALGEHEAALAAAREAVDIRRALAAQRPDVFTPDLAGALMVRAQCLDAAEQLEAAMADTVEAITLLTPAFLRLPQAFAPLIGAMARDYLQRCKQRGVEPDQALLAPIAEVFVRLQAQQGGGG